MLIYKHLLEFFTSYFFQNGANEVVIYNFLALLTIDTNINQVIYRLPDYLIKIK